MARKQKIVGTCYICGQKGPLSFEHVPNRRAFNSSSIAEYTFEDVLVKKDKTKGQVIQGGIGRHTLCPKCNNDTGSWYGEEYTKWAKSCTDFLYQRWVRLDMSGEAVITLHNVYPLRFLKQVVVCFFSVAPGLVQQYPGLVNFVLDKNEKHLPSNCRFYMNFYYGTKPMLRQMPMAGIIHDVHFDGPYFRAAGFSVFTEIAHPPFLLTMPFGTGFPKAGNITGFSEYDYDQQAKNVTLKLRVVKGLSPLPNT